MGEEASADRGCRTGCLGVGELGEVEDVNFTQVPTPGAG